MSFAMKQLKRFKVLRSEANLNRKMLFKNLEQKVEDEIGGLTKEKIYRTLAKKSEENKKYAASSPLTQEKILKKQKTPSVGKTGGSMSKSFGKQFYGKRDGRANSHKKSKWKKRDKSETGNSLKGRNLEVIKVSACEKNTYAEILKKIKTEEIQRKEQDPKQNEIEVTEIRRSQNGELLIVCRADKNLDKFNTAISQAVKNGSKTSEEI